MQRAEHQTALVGGKRVGTIGPVKRWPVVVMLVLLAGVVPACGGSGKKSEAWRVRVAIGAGADQYLANLDGTDGDFAARLGVKGSAILRTGGQVMVETAPFSNQFVGLPAATEQDYRIPSVATIVRLVRTATKGVDGPSPDDTALGDLLSMLTGANWLARPQMAVDGKHLTFTALPADASVTVNLRFEQRESLSPPVQVEKVDNVPSGLEQRLRVIHRT